MSAGRFTSDAVANTAIPSEGRPEEEEIHIHLLARDEEGAKHVLGDLLVAMYAAPQPASAPRQHLMPVQLDLLAA